MTTASNRPSRPMNVTVIGVSCILLFVFGCQSRQEQFARLYRATEKHNVEQMAGRLRPFYPELVDKLSPEEFLKIGHILADHGDWYAAIRLAEPFEKVHGEKKVLVACLLAVFSHGTHEEAVELLHKLPPGLSPNCREIAAEIIWNMKKEAPRWLAEDPKRLGIPATVWSEMDNAVRREAIKRNVL